MQRFLIFLFLTGPPILTGLALKDPLDEANYRVTPRGYANQGKFVQWPAQIGCIAFTSVGYLGTFPLACIRSPGSFLLYSDRVWKYSGVQSKMVLGRLGYYLFGTPALLMKRGFWDTPRFLWHLLYNFSRPPPPSTGSSSQFSG